MENEPQDAYLPKGDSEILEPFDVRQQSSRRGMMKLIGVFVFLCVMAFIIMRLFSSGTRDRDQTPRILADNSPYKEVPLDVGGSQTPNQDKEIYQKQNGTLKEETVHTLPTAEQPLPKPQAVEPPTANVVIKEPVTWVPAKTKPKFQPKPAVKKPAVHKPSGDYVVQVASLRSHLEANTLWSRLGNNLNGVLTSQHSADIKRVDLGAKGIYYRLRVSGLANKEAATALCSRMKARKQDCIVTKK
ncbi:MAG: hypothetical protein COA43_10805 [Robiginitomaculum sp.]|nr:MAG: hypothetical protein COA43_10805 [Robiginitomaculum sp.]